MNRRRSSEAALPHAPLEFAYPLTVSGLGAEGAAVLEEVSADQALRTLRALRLVLAWTRGPEAAAAAVFDRALLDAWEVEVATDPFDENGLWAPLTVLAGELRRPEKADSRIIAQACLAASDWALGEGAERTALLFSEAAALAWPSNPRYAWISGKLARNQGRYREAELWLRRAARVAAWAGDWETQDLALNSLGNLHANQGAYDRALRYLTRALSLAQRHGMRDREGAVNHDLFVLQMTAGDLGPAETHAIRAHELYGSEHPMLRRLAYDVTHLWAQQGRFGAALPVLGALSSHFPEPDLQLRVQAATARAAGAVGDAVIFAESWDHAWDLVRRSEPAVRRAVPSTLVDLGRGAASLGEWARALQALDLAVETAQEQGLHDTTAEAEMVRSMVRRRERAEEPRPVPATSPARRLAHAFVRSLAAAPERAGPATPLVQV